MPNSIIELINKLKGKSSGDLNNEIPLKDLVDLCRTDPGTIQSLIIKELESQEKQTENIKNKIANKKKYKQKADELLGSLLAFSQVPNEQVKQKLNQHYKFTSTLVEAIGGGSFGIDLGWFLSSIGAISQAILASMVLASFVVSAILATALLLFIIVYRVVSHEIQKEEKTAIDGYFLKNIELTVLKALESEYETTKEKQKNEIAKIKKEICAPYLNLVERLEKKANINKRKYSKEEEIEKADIFELVDYLNYLLKVAYQLDLKNHRHTKTKNLLTNSKDYKALIDLHNLLNSLKSKPTPENNNLPPEISKPNSYFLKETFSKIINFFRHKVFKHTYIVPAVVGFSILGGLFFGLYSSSVAMLTMLQFTAAAAFLSGPIGLGIFLGGCLLFALVASYQNHRSLVSLKARYENLTQISEEVYHERKKINKLENEIDGLKKQKENFEVLQKYLDAEKAAHESYTLEGLANSNENEYVKCNANTKTVNLYPNLTPSAGPQTERINGIKISHAKPGITQFSITDCKSGYFYPVTFKDKVIAYIKKMVPRKDESPKAESLFSP